MVNTMYIHILYFLISNSTIKLIKKLIYLYLTSNKSRVKYIAHVNK